MSENTQTTDKKKAGRPATFELPVNTKFTVDELRQKFSVTPAAVHSRLNKLKAIGKVELVEKLNSTTKGRKAGVYFIKE